MNRFLLLVLLVVSFSLQSFKPAPANPDEDYKGLVLMDYQNKYCFVDLMVIDVTVQYIQLKNASDELIEEVDCSRVNMQDIIEFDLSAFPKGSYLLHFKTLSGAFDYPLEL